MFVYQVSERMEILNDVGVKENQFGKRLNTYPTLNNHLMDRHFIVFRQCPPRLLRGRTPKIPYKDSVEPGGTLYRPLYPSGDAISIIQHIVSLTAMALC